MMLSERHAIKKSETNHHDRWWGESSLANNQTTKQPNNYTLPEVIARGVYRWPLHIWYCGFRNRYTNGFAVAGFYRTPYIPAFKYIPGTWNHLRREAKAKANVWWCG